MSIQFYRPNKSNAGFACSFSQNPKTGDIYAAILKQSSYDAEKKLGGFAESRNNPEKHTNIKLGQVEAAAILQVIDRAQPFSTVHDSQKEMKSINFGLWLSKPNADKPDEKPVLRGYSFSINITDKEDSTKKNSFFMGFSFAEGRLIREFLIYSLQTAFRINQENYEANRITE